MHDTSTLKAFHFFLAKLRQLQGLQAGEKNQSPHKNKEGPVPQWSIGEIKMKHRENWGLNFSDSSEFT